MGKKLAKELDGNFKYIKGSYYSEYNEYDVTIRYDYTSMLYNIYLNVKGKEDIEPLNDLLEKIDKHAVAKYKNNHLTISQSCDKLKFMPSHANTILKEVTSYLKKHKYKNICPRCGKENKTSLIDVDGTITYSCNDCYKNIKKKYETDLKNKKKIKENIFLGLLGSIVGCLPGFIVWLILGYFMISPTAMALIIMLGSAYAYKYSANSMKLPGLIISLVVGFAFVLLANEITNAYTLYTEYINQFEINLFDAYKAVPYYINNNEVFKVTYTQSFLLSLVFGVFGALTNFGVHRAYVASNKVKKLEVK